MILAKSRHRAVRFCGGLSTAAFRHRGEANNFPIVTARQDERTRDKDGRWGNPIEQRGEETMRMTWRHREKWSKIRQMGHSRYVRLFWVIGWGLGTGVLWSIFMALTKGWDQLPLFLVLGLIGFPLGGHFLGQMMWKINERTFERADQNA
jgi:hypothetical protein